MAMTHQPDPAAIAEEILAAARYMTLATADAGGVPWASPVYFARDDHGGFLWVSLPETRHSRNIGARPQVGIAIFDSRVPVGQGQGVYVTAEAAEVPEAEIERAIPRFSARSQEDTGRRWEAEAEAVTGAGPYRLYVARPSETWILDPGWSGPGDRRLLVS